MRELVFTAMDGVFPGCDGVPALWQHIVDAQPAPLSALCARWGADPARMLSAAPAAPGRTYMDLGFVLPERAPGSTAHDPRWGRQLGFTEHVLTRLLAGIGTLDRKTLGLVLATSWSDESLYLADAALAAGAESEPGFDPGGQLATLAERLGTGGPRVAVDTACSSFLYAIEVARSLLASGQAAAVLVAGVNTFLPAPLYAGFAQLGALSHDGELAAFAANASGIIPGEAVGAVLLESASSARAAGRQPLGVLRALGLSSDGREGGVFAPGRHGQERAYQRAFAAQRELEVDYVEAHGTGTVVGDRTELETLSAFYGPRLARKLPLGSVKRLMGHSLAAAGATSLIKALCMLQQRCLPPHRVAEPNAALASSCFELPAQAAQWSARERPMRVAVSSFGFGGANAHLVVEAPGLAPAEELEPPDWLRLDLAVEAVDFALPSDGAPTRLFPRGRLTRDEAPPRLAGRFFTGTVDVDVDGFGMGPKPLAEIDPFKLLLAGSLRRVVTSLGLRGDEATGVVACANLGGQRFFDIYRATEGAREGAPPPISVDGVATNLPTMLSGYPALFYDLKGLHFTLSGGSDTWLSALRCAPVWLRDRCSTLLLAAGTYVGSHVDAARRARESAGKHGEGALVFALRLLREGHAPLAILRGFVAAHDASAAARAVGWEAPSHVERCELDPRSELGDAQRATGFLAEATGAEALLAALKRAPARVAIELRRSGTVLGYLLVDALRVPELSAPAPARLPLALTFSADVATPPVEQPEEREWHAIESARREILATMNTPPLLTHFAEVSDIIALDLRVRRRALSLLRRRAPELVRRTENVVLDTPARTASGWSAHLRVREDHPFYFDHPLDHVPGILLLEGMLQLCELAFGGERDWFISNLDVQFRRYAEKDAPIVLQLQARDAKTVEVQVQQGGQLLVSAALGRSHGARAALQALPRPSAQPLRVQLPEARFIHKHRAENVLVAEQLDGGDVLCARTLPVPADHAVADGDPRQLSMLYLLEVGRQTFMLNAHQRWNVPLGLPMNLLRLRFSLNAPLPRDRPLTLVPVTAPQRWNGLLVTGRFALEARLGDSVVGRGEFQAQAIGKDLYAHQRTNKSEKTR